MGASGTARPPSRAQPQRQPNDASSPDGFVSESNLPPAQQFGPPDPNAQVNPPNIPTDSQFFGGSGSGCGAL